MESIYHTNEIVWAKIKGYPWWPGIVSSLFIYFIYKDKKNLLLKK